jgi:hypothetical protein
MTNTRNTSRRTGPCPALPEDRHPRAHAGGGLEILKGLKSRYEEFHRVRYTDEALKSVVELSAKYINDRHLPDKAIDVIDEAEPLCA